MSERSLTIRPYWRSDPTLGAAAVSASISPGPPASSSFPRERRCSVTVSTSIGSPAVNSASIDSYTARWRSR